MRHCLHLLTAPFHGAVAPLPAGPLTTGAWTRPLSAGSAVVPSGLQPARHHAWPDSIPLRSGVLLILGSDYARWPALKVNPPRVGAHPVEVTL
jgi:hypothetical protein